jgi:hypothetical protein
MAGLAVVGIAAAVACKSDHPPDNQRNQLQLQLPLSSDSNYAKL